MSRIRGEVSPIYRRLPHGPNGMRREDVARNQRARLYGAMIESVAQRGYRATTVAHVIGLAGVSRRAFYEQFHNKEQCFLATYDIVVARERKLVIDAWQGERGWANRLHAACKRVLDDFAAAPKGPRLVLVESLGTGPAARERMHLAGHTFERLVAGAFQLAPDGVPLTPLVSRAIVGGVRHVSFTRLRERRERELYALTDEVLDWIEAYRSPAAARLAALTPARPARVPPAPAAFLSSDDKRSRALGSVVHLTLDEGYSRLTDPQIAQFAGISTEAFHKQFPSKEECFLAVLDEFVGEALGSVTGRLQTAPSWPEGVYRAVKAFVDYLVAHQALIRMAFVDVFEVGPAMVGRLMRSTEEFTKLLTENSPIPAPAPRRGPLVAREAITGALWAIISSYVLNNRIARLSGLVDQLAFVVLAPYLGPKEAVAAIESARKPLRAV
jgi:AcrR family transcriptional regulator